jgi:uncharacterized protein
VTTFVDTSALFTVLDQSESQHPLASAWLSGPGRTTEGPLITHNYVVLESVALVHRRLGSVAARSLLEELLPVIRVFFVGQSIHARAVSSLLLALRRRSASLVDMVSFEVMRELGIEQAFAFDRDFNELGFRTVP